METIVFYCIIKHQTPVLSISGRLWSKFNFSPIPDLGISTSAFPESSAIDYQAP